MVAAAFVVFAIWTSQKNKKTVDRVSVKSRFMRSEMCNGKKKCAVVYVAPWCSACESLLPQLITYSASAKKNPDYGMQVIVGFGREAGDNESKAEQIGDLTIVDNTSKMADELGVKYFPTIVVIDEANRIEFRDQDALAWIDQKFSQ